MFFKCKAEGHPKLLCNSESETQSMTLMKTKISSIRI